MGKQNQWLDLKFFQLNDKQLLGVTESAKFFLVLVERGMGMRWVKNSD